MKFLASFLSRTALPAAVLSLLWLTGCQTPYGDADTSSASTTTMPASQTPVASTPATPKSAVYTTGDEQVIYEDHLVVVTKQFVAGTTAGTEFSYRIVTEAKAPLSSVSITEQLPESFDFVSSSPNPTGGAGDAMTWELADIDAGQKRVIDVSVRPNAVGTYTACSTVVALPKICLPIYVGLPQLTIAKDGPARTEIGNTVEWDVTVKNIGTAVAENVVVTDTLPKGFTAVTTLSQSLGDLNPNEGRTVTFAARANEEGQFVNMAQATFDGGEEIIDDAPIVVDRPGISITKTGPEESFIFVNRPYDITVRNTGTTTLRNVVVTDDLPSEYVTVNSTGGGEVLDTDGDGDADRLVWLVGDLAPDQTRAYRVVLTSGRPQVTTNVATVVAEGDLSDQASADTRWKAVPGVLTWIVDDVDPIMVGQETTYTAVTQNQSQFEPFTVTSQTIVFGEEIEILEVSGGTINGNVVTFDSYRLEPREKVTRTIRTRGAQAGSSTAIMQTMTNFIKAPVQNSESTTVY